MISINPAATQYRVQFGEEKYYIDLSKPGAEEALKVWKGASGGQLKSTPAPKLGKQVVQLSGDGLNHCSKGLGEQNLDQFKVEEAKFGARLSVVA